MPTYVTGPMSHAWWAVVILMLVAGSLYLSFVFSYLYVWTVAPQVWPAGRQPGTSRRRTLAVAAVLLLLAARRGMRLRCGQGARSIARGLCRADAARGAGACAAALALEVAGHWGSGLRPDTSGYAALVYLASVLQLQMVAAVVVIGCVHRSPVSQQAASALPGA